MKRRYLQNSETKLSADTKYINKKHWLPLDNSAIIHLASRCKGYTNTFRLAVTLNEKICPKTLQLAVNHITPRFPAIVAGIRSHLFQYVIVPSKVPPKVQQEQELLAFMPKSILKECSVRVLYSENKITVEIFHALTDGYGGIVFLNTLIAEYLSLKHSVSCNYSDRILNPDELPCESELNDDFISHAGAATCSFTHRKIYQIPVRFKLNMPVQCISRTYQMQELINTAHHYGTTLTIFLTAVMYAAVLKLQRDKSSSNKPVQIMVPVNLRNRFASKTLRNFSLYALPYVEASAANISFEYLIQQIAAQINEQTDSKHLSTMISANVRIQSSVFYRILPLLIKNFLLRLTFRLYGERNSCLSFSNLGEITYPKEIKSHISDVEFLLTPRRTSAYNCSVVTYSGKTCISFTKKGDNHDLEEYFFYILENIVETHRKELS